MAERTLYDSSTLTFTASDPNSCPTPRAIKERLVSIRNLAKKNGSGVQFAIEASGAATTSLKRSAPGESDSALAHKKKRSHYSKINGNPGDAHFIDDSEDCDMEQGGTDHANSSPSKARHSTASKHDNGLPTPSGSFKKARHYHSASFSDEAELAPDSDSDSFEYVSLVVNTPSKVNEPEKMKLRAVRRPKYTLDDEEGAADSDVSEFDPCEEQEKEEKKARRRRGMWDTEDVSDET